MQSFAISFSNFPRKFQQNPVFRFLKVGVYLYRKITLWNYRDQVSRKFFSEWKKSVFDFIRTEKKK